MLPGGVESPSQAGRLGLNHHPPGSQEGLRDSVTLCPLNAQRSPHSPVSPELGPGGWGNRKAVGQEEEVRSSVFATCGGFRASLEGLVVEGQDGGPVAAPRGKPPLPLAHVAEAPVAAPAVLPLTPDRPPLTPSDVFAVTGGLTPQTSGLRVSKAGNSRPGSANRVVPVAD